MGWVFTCKPKNQSIKEFFNARFSGPGEVIDAALVNFREVYISYRTKNEVGALICLVEFRPNDLYNFGYKSMDETMLPYYYNCPERILKQLTPTNNNNARLWREACWRRIAKRKAKRLNHGDIIVFSSPLRFSNGAVKDTFLVIKQNNRIIFKSDDGLYRIKNWKKRTFEVINRECC